MNFNPNFNGSFQGSSVLGPVNSAYAYIQQPTSMMAQQVSPFRTNRILVTSLNEALTKQCDYGSEMYYWDQSRPVIYVVRTNMQGVKEWAEIQYVVPSQQESPVNKLDEFEKRLCALERKFSSTGENVMSEQEVNTNAQPIG